ncbi:hypothetical protein EV702DRAFT_1051138 [Suillus placidus]|uniref:Uncharacterized protein n=1 Tax=Suillus placidus TaxID=48579 RepID=A0A9P6ZGE3_9AGAM|nr:hypothetical protein EV702DRAFT_1051138 [Suillus placidus]
MSVGMAHQPYSSATDLTTPRITMSHNLRSAVLMALLAGKEWIFDDKSGMLEDVFGLDEKLFDVPNKWITDTSCYKVLEGKSEGGWSTRHDALHVWFQKQKVSNMMSQQIDEVWMNLGVSPIQLIQDGLEEGEEFPNILDAKCAKEDEMLAILGDHALEQPTHGNFWDAVTTIHHHAWECHHKCFGRAPGHIGYQKTYSECGCQRMAELTVRQKLSQRRS